MAVLALAAGFGLVGDAAAAANDCAFFPSEPINFPVGDSPYQMAIGDMNGDQVPDLAVANSSSDSVSVLLGLGFGMFAAAVEYSGSRCPLMPGEYVRIRASM